MRIWKQLKHPHVLELCGTVTGFGPYTSMVCPWMKNGSVTKYLENCGDILTVEDRLRLVGGFFQNLHPIFRWYMSDFRGRGWTCLL